MENNSPMLAYSYMFKDNKFWLKYLVLLIMTLICILPTLLLGDSTLHSNKSGGGMLLYQVVNIFYAGYTCACIKSLSEQHSNYILPFFNFKTQGIIGLKWLAASLLFGLAVGLVLTGAIIALLIIGIFSKAACIILGAIAAVALVLLIGIYSPAFYRMFAVTQDVFAFFRIKEIFKSVSDNSKNYFKYIGAYYLISFLCFIGLVLFSLPVAANKAVHYTLIGLIMGLGCTYFNFAYMYICAKAIK